MAAGEVRLKDIGYFQGWRENALIGYGIVIGLAGSGDSPRSEVTKQTLSNVLARLGINIPSAQLQSRNVAAVMVTATLPPSANVGDRIDITVSSIGDARSLVGGTLLMTQLIGPDQRTYALAQGSLVVGGYNFQDSVNLRQRNYPTAATVPNGATIESPVSADMVDAEGRMFFVLRNPDFTTAERIAQALNYGLAPSSAFAWNADTVVLDTKRIGGSPTQIIARVENIFVKPDNVARIVINERTGTVVAGGGVRVSEVVIVQGDIRVAVTSENTASQPNIYGGYSVGNSGLIVTNRRLDVTDSGRDIAVSLPNTTVADVVQSLTRARVDTRTIIAILQAMKANGALHAEIIVQ